MKLITEIVEDVNVQQIEESTRPGRKVWVIEGVFMAASDPDRNILEINRNKRSYPKRIVEREVARYINTFIKENRALGELGHPPGPAINLDRAAIAIKEMRQDGHLFYGKAQLLDTPCGMIAQKLLEAGVRLAVSSRGVGNLVERNGYYEVQDDFFLATPADLVADPSCPHAFVNGIMEGKDWVYVEGQGWTDHFIDQTRKQIAETVNKEDREKLMLESFQRYMSALSNGFRL